MTQSAGDGRPRVATTLPLEEGVCYLVKGKSVDPCYQLAQRRSAARVPVLCVSRIHPDRLRTKYGLARAAIWWITGSPGENHFDPTAIGTLSSAMEGFIDGHADGCLVVLDGIEYITVHVGFPKALFFAEHLNEYVMPRRATMWVPVDPDCFEPTEFARLDRFMDGITESELREALDSGEPEHGIADD